MIQHLFNWLKSLYYIPVTASKTATHLENSMNNETLSFIPQPGESIASLASAAAVLPVATPVAVSNEAITSPLAEFKSRIEAFVAFVEKGIEVLGQDAEAELVALKEKYL